MARHGDVTTEDVVRALVILVAGTDTTRLTTSLAVKTLLSHPAEFDRLRENRGDVKNAVMELLRFESPTKFLVRVAVEDVAWEAQTIARGTIVLLSIMGAGWDPRAFPNPERFDVRRDLMGSLNFGFGSGYCLGVHLARLQVGTLVEFLLDHPPSTATSTGRRPVGPAHPSCARSPPSCPRSLGERIENIHGTAQGRIAIVTGRDRHRPPSRIASPRRARVVVAEPNRDWPRDGGSSGSPVISCRPTPPRKTSRRW
jgi:hypothetical protein